MLWNDALQTNRTNYQNPNAQPNLFIGGILLDVELVEYLRFNNRRQSDVGHYGMDSQRQKENRQDVLYSRTGRMNYAEARRHNLSIGSGVIESTIRRVVNLRLKATSVYWKESTAEDSYSCDMCTRQIGGKTLKNKPQHH